MKTSLSQFVGVHAGQRAWVLGKGSSLSKLKVEEIDGITCCINDTVQVVPSPDYGFSNDGFKDWQDLYLQGFTVFQPERTTKLHHGEQRDDINLISYVDHAEKKTFDSSPSDMARDGLTMREGTLGSVVQILFIMGIKEIVAVGIDGGNHHCQNWQWRTQLQNEHFKHYNRFRHGFIADCQHFGINVVNPDGTQFDKTMKIRILSACSLSGGRSFSPHDKETPEVSADEAALLVGVGRAEYVTESPEAKKTEDGSGEEFVSSYAKLAEALNLTSSELGELREIKGAPEKDEEKGHSVKLWKEFAAPNA